MRRVGGGVQFFDLVEVDWRSDHEHAAIVAKSSGCTGGATGATCTAVLTAGARAVGGRLEARDGAIARRVTDGRTTAIASGRSASDTEPAAWRIKVPQT